MFEEKGWYGEYLLEEKFRSWVWRLKSSFVRVRVQYGHRWGTHASAIVEPPRGDVWRLDSGKDGDREGLRLMGSVANEERIDGEVETGNPDPRDQNPPLVEDLSYSSIVRKSRKCIYTVGACQLC